MNAFDTRVRVEGRESLQLLLRSSLLIGFILFVTASSAYGAGIKKGGNCPWEHLPADTRSAALEAGLIGGPASMMPQIPKAQMAAAERSCEITAENQAAYRRAEAGHMLRVLSEAALAKRLNLAPDRLNAAWNRAGSRVKEPARRWAIYLTLEQSELDRLYAAFVETIGLNIPPSDRGAKPEILSYLHGRALVGVYDAEL